MKRGAITTLAVAVILVSAAGTAGATIILDPTASWTDEFVWYDLGQIDGIIRGAGGGYAGFGGDIDWGITVGQDSVMTFASAWDDYIPGDEFSLVLDGSAVAWTTEYTDGSGYYHGEYDDLFLSAGYHTLTLEVITLTSGFIDGTGWATFSATEPVPEPASMTLLGIGLAGWGLRRLRKRS